MEASPVNGSNGFRGRGGRGGGSPFRGRGASPGFRGRGGPDRGRGGPFRGGRGSFRGGENGQAPFRGGGRGQGSARLNPTRDYLQPMIRNGLERNYYNFQALFEITNLPTILLKDVNVWTKEIKTFVLERTGCSVTQIMYQLPSDTSPSLTVVCQVMGPEFVAVCADKLHGQVFQGRHLLVNKNFGAGPGQLENCVKVFTQKPVTTEVTEETLYSLFETCGNLQVIRLTNCKPDSALEALITFGDSDSVLNALKLDGSKLDKSKIHVVSLGQFFVNVSPAIAVDSLLKDFNIIHVDKLSTGSAYVYFSDEESISKALKLDGNLYDGVTKVVITEGGIQSQHSVFIGDPDSKLNHKQLMAVFGASEIAADPSRSDVHVITFNSKTGADNALKASPVLISNNLYNVYDSASKIPIVVKSEDSKVEDEEEEDQEEVDDEEEEDDEEGEEEVSAEEGGEEVSAEEEEGDDEEGEEEEDEEEEEQEDGDEDESSEEEAIVVPTPPSGKKGLQKQPPAQTDLKRKRNDSKTQKGGNKKQKA